MPNLTVTARPGWVSRHQRQKCQLEVRGSCKVSGELKAGASFSRTSPSRGSLHPPCKAVTELGAALPLRQGLQASQVYHNLGRRALAASSGWRPGRLLSI